MTRQACEACVLMMMLMSTVWGCASHTRASPERSDLLITSAPYDKADPELWTRFFHENRSDMSPDVVASIIDRAIREASDLDQVASVLTGMGVPNTVRMEKSDVARFGTQVPHVTFYLKLNHRNTFWTIRDVYGVVLEEPAAETNSRVIAKNIATGP